MDWKILILIGAVIVASVLSFAVYQYQQTQRQYITNGYVHCPYQGSLGYYWAKECK